MKKSNSKNNKQKNKNLMNTVLIFILSGFLLLGTATFFILSSILAKAPEVNISDLSSKGNSRIYDIDGKVIMELGEENRENISIDKVPHSVIDAFLAVEDSRYFKHNGFDLPRFLKSAMNNLRSGSLAEGGSTLTMQMIDVQYFQDKSNIYDADGNIIGSPSSLEKVEFKIQEIFMSLDVESKTNKLQILEDYLNRINFGGSARGIQKGAQYYFSKDVTQLTLSESAFLAGVVNAPNFYNPYYGISIDGNGKPINHYEEAVKRRDNTLYLMNYHGYITDTEYKLALKDELAFQLGGENSLETTPYMSYTDVAIKEARELTGKDPYTTPMDIYTYMDRDAQNLSDDILNEKVFDFPNATLQTGFTLMDNQTGRIIAMGAGRGYGGDVRYNRANDVAHNPGSSIKPLMDYAPAFEYLGWSTSHVLEDKPITYTGTTFRINNADGYYRGDVNLQTCINSSLNTTAIQALQQVIDKVGTDDVVKLMNKMGLTQIDEEDFTLGYGIGGSNLQATPTQMAGAYSIFANSGKYIKPHTVGKVEFHDGSSPIEPEYDKVKVISEESAYQMTYLLENAVKMQPGTLSDLLKDTYQVAAKTGTSDWGDLGLQYGIPKASMKDKWVCAYTSKYTVSAWAGYDKPGPNAYINNYVMNYNVPGKICNLLLDVMAKKETQPNFTKPDNVVAITHVNGLYPYALPPENSNKELAVTGFINKKFAKLQLIAPDELSKLEAFNIEFDASGGIINLDFTPYSNPDKLKLASSIISYNELGSGKRIFDKSFLFGAVCYKADLYVDDVFVKTYTFSNDKASINLNFAGGENVKVVGYYGYTISPLKSNEISKTFTGEAPKFEETREENGVFILGDDYMNIFSKKNPYNVVETEVKQFMNNMCPGVKYKIVAISGDYPDGSYVPGSIGKGSKLKPNDTEYEIKIYKKV